MKRYIWFIVGIVILSLLTTIIYISVKESNTKFNTFVFPSTISIENDTKYSSKLDTICGVLLHEVMEYDTITLKIYRLSKLFNNPSDMVVVAYLVKNQFNEHYYMLYIREGMGMSQLKEVLSHEIIHLKQMEELILVPVYMDMNGVMYKDVYVSYKNVPYDQREYEKEAFDGQDYVLARLNSVLYKK